MGYTFDLKKMGPEQSLEARKRELDVACAREGEKIRAFRTETLAPETDEDLEPLQRFWNLKVEGSLNSRGSSIRIL